MSLYDELTTGPLSAEIAPHIASGNDGAIVEILNRKDIPVYGELDCNKFASWATQYGQRSKIEDAANDTNDVMRDVALSLRDLLLSNRQIDFSDPSMVALATAWKYAGKMTQADLDALLELSIKQISRADQLAELGIYVDAQKVAQALRG